MDNLQLDFETETGKVDIVPNSVGSFRNDLKKLRLMRKTTSEQKTIEMRSDMRSEHMTSEKMTSEHMICSDDNKVICTENIICTEIITSTMIHDIKVTTTDDNKVTTSGDIKVTITGDDILPTSIDKSFRLIPPPSNPLIDQTIKIIKPTEWIDCISRESKRVFVKDNWIVARILLPSVSKDSIGLKRLTLE